MNHEIDELIFCSVALVISDTQMQTCLFLCVDAITNSFGVKCKRMAIIS